MLAEKLREILAVRGMSKDELAEMCDLPLETIKNIYYGKTADPKISTVLKISKSLNISVNCLMGECSHTMEERVLLGYFRECGAHGKRISLLVSKYEAMLARDERKIGEKHVIPCLIPQGDVHYGIDYDKCEVTDIYTVKEEACMALKITNNDFVPIYCKGDVVLVANRFPAHKEMAIFYHNGRAYLRQYREEENQYRLKCLHNCTKDMVFRRMDEIEYVGTCCGVLRA